MRNVSFISGTRADYGKIKPYIEFLLKDGQTHIFIFITGTHLLPDYGETFQEIERDFNEKCTLVYDPHIPRAGTAAQAAHIMAAYDKHLREDKIDFVFVHGDRPEILSAAFAAVLNNVPVAHIEAGDLSGSIDESVRHAVSKLSHKFLVADERARRVLIQMGETADDIFIVGTSSLANALTIDNQILERYGLTPNGYGVLMYHPVTTLSPAKIKQEITSVLKTLDKSGYPILIFYPNNDLNRDVIVDVYENYPINEQFHFFKSLPFDVFTQLLVHARFLVGNSSCGVKETPRYGVPTIDIGCRQNHRYNHLKLSQFYHLDTADGLEELLKTIEIKQPVVPDDTFRNAFFEKLRNVFTEKFWHPCVQKKIKLNFDE